MDNITQIEDTNSIEREIRAENLVRETKVLNITRLAMILVDLFGSDEPFKKLRKIEGKEVEMYLKELNGYITFTLTSDRNNFNCRAERAKDPIAKIIVNVEEKDIVRVISNIIRSKSNVFGLMKLIKYILPGKVKIKGSIIAVLKLVRCLMIGKHEVYKKKK